MIQKTIPEADITTVMNTVSDVNENGEHQFKKPLTDEHLKSSLEAARKAADDGQVPEDVPEINFAEAFDKAVDEVLNDAPATDTSSGS